MQMGHGQGLCFLIFYYEDGNRGISSQIVNNTMHWSKFLKNYRKFTTGNIWCKWVMDRIYIFGYLIMSIDDIFLQAKAAKKGLWNLHSQYFILVKWKEIGRRFNIFIYFKLVLEY